jgi:general secretion pathway protein D
VPGLGWLFKNRNANRVRKNLYVFIRPTILRDGVDASAATAENYRAIRELQMLQAEDEIKLLRDEVRPVLPEIPELQNTQPSP